jgi:hypothetical protein
MGNLLSLHKDTLRLIYRKYLYFEDRYVLLWSVGVKIPVLLWSVGVKMPEPSRFYDPIAYKGYINLIKWVKENGVDLWYYARSMISNAAAGGQFEVVKWLHATESTSEAPVCIKAAKNGHFEILRWAVENGYRMDCLICRKTAENGHFEILQWIIDQNAYIDEWTPAFAAKGGHLEILKYLESKCRINGWSYAYAAVNGHIHIMEWLKENGYIMIPEAFSNAVSNGQLETLKWLDTNGCPCPTALKLSESIKKCKNIEVLKWLEENKYI